ncbi:translation elongation factor Ts [Candidatus Erwinia haradaeae]|uniref:Elongation factor Ts n=1 Tax=Candidatus Erwinia haradaeae TaxID=1922217 RepID=A0A451D205_9GAMM|nr:translation elongation factor Ts [Candidatus Erwinia haradaeae]VFP79636.1 Elongation factor Ts [Candidatus Erwinia haradaeae]
MDNITAALIKDLRERTGSGIMDCKKALSQANGNIDLAIKNMRKLGMIKAAKKSSHIATEGVIRSKIQDNYGVILEINCQTDFVAKNSDFQLFADKILNFAVLNKINDVLILESQFSEERIKLISYFGENINIRRISSLEGVCLDQYIHCERIGVLISMNTSDIKFIRQIAMHIAASKPEYIQPEDVPTEVMEQEYQLQLEISMQSGKSRDIIDKIVQGRMQKFMKENSLIGQPFIFNPEKTVGQFLKEIRSTVVNFIRLEVGEGIIK